VVLERSGRSMSFEMNLRLNERSTTISGRCAVREAVLSCEHREGAARSLQREPEGPLPGKLTFERRSGPMADAPCQ
jgi:hypothetical protein